jgi:hypothetical protein
VGMLASYASFCAVADHTAHLGAGT